MIGILVQTEDRPDIVFDNGQLYGGLHCGMCFRILDEMDGWIPVRLELQENWILVIGATGKMVPVPYGRRVWM